MKILIVDDELLARDSIMSGLSSFDNMEFIQAENGNQAYELILQQKPEIVIADIRMPGIDGLELLSKVREIPGDILFIFISGYDLFEYAQKAVRLGAFNYLLKPINTSELKEVVDAACKKIAVQNSLMESETLIKIKANQGAEIMRRQFVYELATQKSLPGPYISKKLSQLNVKMVFDSFCIAVLSWSYPTDHDKFEKDKSLVKFSMENILSEIIEKNALVSYPFDINDDIGILLNFPLNNTLASNIYDVFCEIKDSIFSYLEYTVTIGIGKTVNGLHELHQSFETAQKALARRLINGNNQIYIFDGSSTSKDSSIFIDSILEQKIIASFERCDLSSAVKAVEDLYINSAIIRTISTENIKKLNLQLILLFFKTLTRMHLNPETILEDEFVLYNEVNLNNSIEAMCKWFVEKLEICFKAIDSASGKSARISVEMAKAFINSNLSSELTLENVSDFIHLSPNYFSKLFRQETGTTFIEYVTECRINKAKQLLSQGIYKANEISRMVGFVDLRHFYKVFKKQTGFTAGKYKNTKIKKGDPGQFL